MTVEQVRETVEQYFQRWRGASLKLPNGWFGRPHDNFHELTSISVRGGTLVIVLDDHLVLSLVRPTTAIPTDASLRIAGFARAEWDWREYGSNEQHHEEFDGGIVEFVASK